MLALPLETRSFYTQSPEDGSCRKQADLGKKKPPGRQYASGRGILKRLPLHPIAGWVNPDGIGGRGGEEFSKGLLEGWVGKKFAHFRCIKEDINGEKL